MKKIHKSTTLALLLNIAAVCLYAAGHPMLSSVCSMLAFFAAFIELAKYTSRFQFSMLYLSAALTGIFLDFPSLHFIPFHFPFITVILLLSASAAIVRIIFFRFFSYTSHSWFEPVVFILALILTALAALTSLYDWPAYAIATPLIIGAGLFAWGTLKDKKQLFRNSGGYKVQIGQPASEFQLSDQDGNLVKLSDFKGTRHLLLIFVRGDWCPGCHMMLRTYEKNNEKFKTKNVLVMAIGPDPVGVNREMVEKLGLDFKVLSDEGQRTAMVYGVQLKGYEHTFAETYEEGIPLPASFLIDKAGIVRYVSRPDKVGEFLNPGLIFPIVDQLS